MNKELAAYLRLEATVAAAFGFFITGMAVALIYRRAESVPISAAGLAVDALITCLATFTLAALFSRASLRRSKTAGLLAHRGGAAGRGSRARRFFSRLFRQPLGFGLFTGFVAAALLFALLAPLCGLLGVTTLPFGLYVALKCVLGALLAGAATLAALYAGLHAPA